MSDKKVSAMTAATLPLTGAELVPIVQGGANRQAPVSSLLSTLSPLSKLSSVQQKTVAPFVQHVTPTPGNSITLATLTGAGTIQNLWITVEDVDAAWNDRLQIFYDGSLIPDFDCDLGTLFLTHLDAHTGTGGSFSTEHMLCAPYGSARPGSMSGGILFPIPYGNGCVIKLLCPLGGSSVGGNSLYTQIHYQAGVTSAYRLRSQCRPYLSAAHYTLSEIITFFDMPNAAGHLVWQSCAVTGDTNETYLERIWFWGIDGEATTPDGNGVITTAFSCSGGEDLFLSGWYFVGLPQIKGQPWTIVAASNNGNFTTVAGFDFLAAYGGLKFTTELKPGWSLKPGGYITSGHTMSWAFLYYIDTTVPFTPSAPSLSAVAGNGQVTLTITPPVSLGSSVITTYAGTYSPGGGAFTPTVGATSIVVSGLTNGTAYTFSLTATNSVGTSSPGSVVSTPVGLPVITTGTILSYFDAGSLGLSDGSVVTAWTKTSGSSSVQLVQPATYTGPTYKVGVFNGRNALRFNFASLNVLTANTSYLNAAPTCCICVIKASSTSNFRVWDTYISSPGPNGRALGGINGSGNWATYAGTADAQGPAADTLAHVVSFVQNGANSYVAVDGVASAVNNAGSGGIDKPNVGLDGISPLTPGSGITGDLPAILFISGAISSSDRHALEVYLGSLYGVTVV